MINMICHDERGETTLVEIEALDPVQSKRIKRP